MGRDYSDIGLSKNLQSLTGVTQRRQPLINNMRFDANYEVQTKNLAVSRLHSRTLIQLSNASSASGAVGAGTHVVVTTSLTPDINVLGTSYINFAIPFVSIYEGTSAVGTMQIYPGFGSGVAADKFRLSSGFDYRQLGNGGSSVFRIQVHNTSGTTADIYADTRWKVFEHSGVQPA